MQHDELSDCTGFIFPVGKDLTRASLVQSFLSSEQVEVERTAQGSSDGRQAEQRAEGEENNWN